jgi:molybdopterin-guanine dinucleotide biosynthesis protein A
MGKGFFFSTGGYPAKTKVMQGDAGPLKGVLLCGGNSTRMGTDKAMLKVDGEVLWKRQIRILGEAVGSQVAVAGKKEGPWTASGWEVVPDLKPGVGPLGGIGGGLKWAEAGHLVVLAVDLPQMRSQFLAGLIARRKAGIGVVGVLEQPCGTREREPLAAVYPVEASEIVEEEIRRGRFSLRGLWQRLAEAGRCEDVLLGDQDLHLFVNLNRPADLESLKRGGHREPPLGVGKRP